MHKWSLFLRSYKPAVFDLTELGTGKSVQTCTYKSLVEHFIARDLLTVSCSQIKLFIPVYSLINSIKQTLIA